ncbi:MAG: hypothetical protein Q9174_002807 [Haloplaca sp. 1 TL-2023]
MSSELKEAISDTKAQRRQWEYHQDCIDARVCGLKRLEQGFLAAVRKRGVVSFEGLMEKVNGNSADQAPMTAVFQQERKLMRNLHIFSDLHLALQPHIEGWGKPLCWHLLYMMSTARNSNCRKLFTHMLEALGSVHDYVATVVKALQNPSHYDLQRFFELACETLMRFDKFIMAHMYVVKDGS